MANLITLPVYQVLFILYIYYYDFIFWNVIHWHGKILLIGFKIRQIIKVNSVNGKR